MIQSPIDRSAYISAYEQIVLSTFRFKVASCGCLDLPREIAPRNRVARKGSMNVFRDALQYVISTDTR